MTNPIMPHPILSRIPILRKFVDERFLEHRRRSSSQAGIFCACLAVGLEYRYWVDHIWSWDLFALALLFVGIKLALFIWYRFKD
jgi:hypothetical protein